MEDREDWPMGRMLIVAVLAVVAVMAVWYFTLARPALTPDEVILMRARVVLVCDDGTWVKLDEQTNKLYATKISEGVQRMSEVSTRVSPAVICSN
jgi:hypothetical protein